MSVSWNQSLRGAVQAAQSPIAAVPVLARTYLEMAGRILRCLPDGLAKKRMVNAIEGTRWPALRFEPRRVHLGHTAVNLVPHPGEFDFRALFYRRLPYEREVLAMLEPRVRECDAVLEIGANVGVFTLFFSKCLEDRPDASVFSFEPNVEAFSRLLENLRVNGVRNVRPFNLAVARQAGFLPFFEPEGHLTNGSLRAEFAEIFDPNVRFKLVPAIAASGLHSLLADHQRVLLKIDVEGSEPDVLTGLQDWIKARRPEIILEVLPTNAGELASLDFIQRLYRPHLIAESGLVERPAMEPDARHRDYLLLPKVETQRASSATRFGGNGLSMRGRTGSSASIDTIT